MSTEAKQLMSIKRAKPGSFWSNKVPEKNLYKNIGGIQHGTVAFHQILKWWPKRVVQNLPKKPAGGYKSFGQRMFKPCNMGEVVARLRADPSTAEQDHVFWIGHASQLLCLRSGTNIILDPIFSKRASPLSFAGPKRRYPPACSLDELPPIDICLISHNHYDHLDKTGVKGIYKRNPDVQFIVPMNMTGLITNWGIPATSILEMDWQDEVAIRDVIVCCTPAQHWGKHSMCDNNEVLWCGWVIGWNKEAKPIPFFVPSPMSVGKVNPILESLHATEYSTGEGDEDADGFPIAQPRRSRKEDTRELQSNSTASMGTQGSSWNQARSSDNLLPVDWSTLKTYYFTGDTAFNEVVFEQIHARIDHIAMAALPIGAYAPRWFMQGQHIDPESAVKVFKIVNCKQAYGVHYGTFELADEPVDEPPQVLEEALLREGVNLDRFVTIPMGNHISF